MIIHHFTSKNIENIEMIKKAEKMKTLVMKLALYKGYFMLNLARKGLNCTVNFVRRFHRFHTQPAVSGGVRSVGYTPQPT